MNKNILIVAGEASGDLHGADLIYEMKKISPNLFFFGIGGEKMIEAGMTTNYHINKMSFLGLIEVVKHIPFLKKVQRELISLVKEKKISTAILIDYPGFNLSLAKKLKALKVKIIYYISPQIWAWGMNRIHKIKKLVDKMLVIFPFEETIYKQHNVDAKYVGNPLIEKINRYKFLSRNELFEKFNIPIDKKILLILPGSRVQEVVKILPDVISASEKLAAKYNLQVVINCSNNVDENIFQKILVNKKFILVKGFTYDLLKNSEIGIIKSGTSTLEAALLGLPMVIVYKTNPLTFFVGKKLVKVKNIGLANIVAQENVITELLQNEVNEKNLIIECEKFLKNVLHRNIVSQKLIQLKNVLGIDNASKNSAEIICELLNET